MSEKREGISIGYGLDPSERTPERGYQKVWLDRSSDGRDGVKFSPGASVLAGAAGANVPAAASKASSIGNGMIVVSEFDKRRIIEKAGVDAGGSRVVEGVEKIVDMQLDDEASSDDIGEKLTRLLGPCKEYSTRTLWSDNDHGPVRDDIVTGVDYCHMPYDYDAIRAAFRVKDGSSTVEFELPDRDGRARHAPGRERLDQEGQIRMDGLAARYDAVCTLGDAKLPVLISEGFALTAGDRSSIVGEGGLLRGTDGVLHDVLFVPVIVDSVFRVPAEAMEAAIASAEQMYPDIDHRKLWLGGAPIEEEGAKLALRMLYYVPDAARDAPRYINGPPLGFYPTASFPKGHLKLSDAAWSFRSIRCADFDGIPMALVIPFDDLVGMDLVPHDRTRSLPPFEMPDELPEPALGSFETLLDYGFAKGIYSTASEHVSRYAGSMGSAIVVVFDTLALDLPKLETGMPGTLLAPPLCEIMQVQRPTVLAGARLPTDTFRVGRRNTYKPGRPRKLKGGSIPTPVMRRATEDRAEIARAERIAAGRAKRERKKAALVVQRANGKPKKKN